MSTDTFCELTAPAAAVADGAARENRRRTAAESRLELHAGGRT